MIYLTRRERFSAAHRMYREEWTDEKNREVYGKCSNPNWHGHNYVLWVTVKGEPSDNNGFVINAGILKEIILNRVVNKLDHRNMNLDVDFMAGGNLNDHFRRHAFRRTRVETCRMIHPHRSGPP